MASLKEAHVINVDPPDQVPPIDSTQAFEELQPARPGEGFSDKALFHDDWQVTGEHPQFGMCFVNFPEYPDDRDGSPQANFDRRQYIGAIKRHLGVNHPDKKEREKRAKLFYALFPKEKWSRPGGKWSVNRLKNTKFPKKKYIVKNMEFLKAIELDKDHYLIQSGIEALKAIQKSVRRKQTQKKNRKGTNQGKTNQGETKEGGSKRKYRKTQRKKKRKTKRKKKRKTRRKKK